MTLFRDLFNLIRFMIPFNSQAVWHYFGQASKR